MSVLREPLYCQRAAHGPTGINQYRPLGQRECGVFLTTKIKHTMQAFDRIQLEYPDALKAGTELNKAFTEESEYLAKTGSTLALDPYVVCKRMAHQLGIKSIGEQP